MDLGVATKVDALVEKPTILNVLASICTNCTSTNNYQHPILFF
jgi:hypothetical protein